MRLPCQPIALPTALLLMAALPLGASTTTLSTTRVLIPLQTSAAHNLPSALDSLRADVAQHPGDYITFETEAGARRFLAEHHDALAETDRTMLQRGILGYWQSRSLAVVPTLNRLQASH